MTVLAAAMTTVLAAMPTLEPERSVAAAAAIAIGVGVLRLVARLLRIGGIASFLSRPILVGFFAGISLSILVGQIGRLTGLRIESEGLARPILETLAKAGGIHWTSLGLGLAMLAILEAVRIARLSVPGPVVVVVLSVALSIAFDFEGRGIAVVGSLPTGLPGIGLPDLSGLPLNDLLLGTAAVFLVSFSTLIIGARSFGTHTREPVDANAELVGFGASNLATGLVGGFPVTVADSRTAVNLSVGGRTQLTSIVAAATLAFAVLFLGNLLRVLPLPALGAILVGAALSLIDVESLKQIWRISRIEFVFAMITMAGAINFGVLRGVIIAIAATLVYVIYKGMHMHPRVVMLGRLPGRDGFFKLHRSDDVRPVRGFAVCLVQGNLLFYSSDPVKACLEARAASLPPDTRWFVLDATAVAQVDSTAAGVLSEFRERLSERGIRLAIAELHADARGLLERAGVIEAIGASMVFEDLEDALGAFEALRREERDGTVPKPNGRPR